MKTKTPPSEIAELITDLKNKHAEAAKALAQFSEKEQTRLAAIASLRSEIDETRHQATALLDAPGNATEVASRKRRLSDSIEIQEHRIKRLEIVLDDDLEALRAPQKPFFRSYNHLSAGLVRAAEHRRQQLLDELGVTMPAPMPPRDLMQSGPGRLGVKSLDPDVLPTPVNRELQQFEALDFKPCTADLSKPTPHQIESDLKAAEEKLPLLIDKIQQCGEALMQALAQIDAEPATSLAPGPSLRNRGNAILAKHKALQETKSPALKPSDTPRHAPAGRFAL